MIKQHIWFCLVGFYALILISVHPAQAQQQSVTVALPIFAETLLDESIVDDFEAQYDVQVKFIYTSNTLSANNAPQNIDNIEGYSEDVQAYMESADVLYIDESLIPEITRAGYLLDLNPLISADLSINPNVFYTSVWNSYMWDGGLWAVPIASQPLFVDYNIDAFDVAGLNYPNSNWTLDDFAFAARQLAEFDDNGQITLPSIQINPMQRNALFHALLDTGFHNTDSFPETPRINNPQLAELLVIWNDLLMEGVVQIGGNSNIAMQNSNIPIQIGSGRSFTITIGSGDADDPPTEPIETSLQDSDFNRGIAPLPNVTSVLLTTGLGISAGTSKPEMAYNLVRYLSEQQVVTNLVPDSEPARRDYLTEASAGMSSIVFNFGADRSNEELALINDALENGSPTANLRFSQYLNTAITEIQAGTDPIFALQAAELNGLEIVQAMDNIEVNFMVTSGLITPVAEGEVTLRFGFQSFSNPLPNQVIWDTIIAEFVERDPQIGAINFDIINLAQRLMGTDTKTYDCSYYPRISSSEIGNKSSLPLALDPLIASDPNYHIDDLPTGTIELVQSNGITYGLPITIQPELLQYNPTIFEQAGIPEPIGGWTISEFGDALAALDLVLSEDTVPFESTGLGNSNLLMLIAGQGGLPIDTRTSPPTINFTSPETVAAIQQILIWMNDGYIDPSDSNMDGTMLTFGNPDSDSPIIPMGMTGMFRNPDMSYTTYPNNSVYTPLSFDVGAGYINAETAIPEACFRWLSHISRHPELFPNAMPAQVSLLDSPIIHMTFDVDNIEAYRSIAQQMSDPNIVGFSNADPFMSTWLTRAMNAYLDSDADLLTELEDAQQYTLDYLACLDAAPEQNRQLIETLNSCVEFVDSLIGN